MNANVNACDAAVAEGHRSTSFSDTSEVSEMRAFTKRLEEQELQKMQQRFAPLLEAANVPYQVWPHDSRWPCDHSQRRTSCQSIL